MIHHKGYIAPKKIRTANEDILVIEEQNKLGSFEEREPT